MTSDKALALINTKKTVAIAVSGGRDSMALLHWFISNRTIIKPDFFVINIEHGIRGRESVEDTRFVREFCAENGIRFEGACVEAGEYSKENGISLETAARILRHRVFASLEADAVCLAHHKDDNVESILMHLFRGAGLTGLRGMSLEDGKILRPFIGVTRDEIDSYITNNNVPYREDSTNLREEFSRNYMRYKVVPAIKEKYPAYADAVLKCAESVRGAESLIESKRDKIAEPFLPKRAFTGEPYLNYLNIKDCIESLGIFADIEKPHYKSVEALFDMPAGKQADLPHFVTAVRKRDGIQFIIEKDKAKKKKKNYGRTNE